MATELITLKADTSDDPRFAVCYGRGATLKREGNFHRVEKGKRHLVHRALCVTEAFGSKCKQCPNHNAILHFQARGGTSG